MKRILNIEAAQKIGEKVKLSGWVNVRRDHGKIIFIDLRDRSGLMQLVMYNKDVLETAATLSLEDLIEVEGDVQKRPDKLVNPKLSTGAVEIGVTSLKILSKSAELPFEINKDTIGVNELIRMKYRYLDLRSERMLRNMEMRHKMNMFFRNYFSERGFLEVETPLLTKGTPEGAREFIVPSRLHSSKFYVLPQSPQQLKQMLMVAGVEKYFQIARCFRDEDQRGDRQPEFTQLDLEMSFVEQEDILNLMEEAMIKLVEEIFPDLGIMAKPFPRITYAEVIKKYNSDKPDLRKEKDNKKLAFCWVVDFPLFEQSESEEKLVSAHHPFTHPCKEDIKLLDKEPLKARAIAYDLVLNGSEVGGGSIRISERDLQEKIFSILGIKKADIQERFGHMLEAFKFSPPPHGGIALGLDRLISILAGEDSIREIIAFPKTGDAVDPLTGAPTELSKQMLKEVHIKWDCR